MSNGFTLMKYDGVSMMMPDLPRSYQATHYVAPTGKDTNPGTATAPFKTIAKALTKCLAGGKIQLAGGLYEEAVQIGAALKASAVSPLVLFAKPGETPILQPPHDYYVAAAHTPTVRITGSGGKYVILYGLTIRGYKGLRGAPTADEDYGADGISFTNGAGVGCEIVRCVIEHCQHCGIKEMGHGGYGILIEQNRIADCGTDWHDHCIYLPTHNCIIRSNWLISTTGWGVHLYSGDPARVYGNQVYNNILTGAACEGVVVAGPNNLIANNVIYGNGRAGIKLWRAGCTGNRFEKNVVFNHPGNNQFLADAAGKPVTDPACPRGNFVVHNISPVASHWCDRGVRLQTVTDELFHQPKCEVVKPLDKYYDFRLIASDLGRIPYTATPIPNLKIQPEGCGLFPATTYRI